MATVTKLPAVRRDPPEICAEIADLQKKRRYCIKEQSRSLRSIEAFLARLAGYHTGLPKDERKRLMKFAQNMRKRIEAEGADWQPPGSGLEFRHVAELVFNTAGARAPFDDMRETIENEIKALARQLPVWAWVKSIAGVAELGLGVIVGESGDLGNYANPAKLWKRLGLAVIEGNRQGAPGEGASKEDWIEHGYNRERRAEVWAFLSDVMFRAQWRGDRDEDGKDPKKTEKPVAVPAHPIGPYGEIYAQRKEWNLARGLVPAHAEADARRIMSKRFVRDLWTEWQRAALEKMEPSTRMPPVGFVEDAAE